VLNERTLSRPGSVAVVRGDYGDGGRGCNSLDGGGVPPPLPVWLLPLPEVWLPPAVLTAVAELPRSREQPSRAATHAPPKTFLHII